ncbi:MAG: hypothetical protein ACI9SE_004908, partial [Neolewinella sp.]
MAILNLTRNSINAPALLASVALMCAVSPASAQEGEPALGSANSIAVWTGATIKKSKRVSLATPAATVLWGNTSASSDGGPTAPSLGNAHSFALLGGQTVTVAAIGTMITGNVGTSPGTSITGFPAGGTVVAPFTTHSTDSAAIAAQVAASAVYTVLASTGGAQLIPAELGGTTLNPGTYYFSSSANIAATTTLTLDGEGVYIFKVGSAITANVHSHVDLINGAAPCQVFWQVTSAATLNGVDFSGTVVAQAAITLGVDAVLHGRAWTTAAGAVTLAGNNTVSCTNLCATYAAASQMMYGSGCGSVALTLKASVLPESSLPVMGTIAKADITNCPTQTAAVTIGFTDVP